MCANLHAPRGQVRHGRHRQAPWTDIWIPTPGVDQPTRETAIIPPAYSICGNATSAKSAPIVNVMAAVDEFVRAGIASIHGGDAAQATAFHLVELHAKRIWCDRYRTGTAGNRVIHQDQARTWLIPRRLRYDGYREFPESAARTLVLPS